MQFEEIKKYLIKVQEESFQTRVLNVILSCFEEIEGLKQANNEIRDKINEIIKTVNGGVETVNNDIQEDIKEEDLIVEDTGAAASNTTE